MPSACATCGEPAAARSRMAAAHFCGAECRDAYVARHHEEHGADTPLMQMICADLPPLAAAWRTAPGRYMVPRRIAAAVDAHLERIGPNTKRQADEPGGPGKKPRADQSSSSSSSSSSGAPPRTAVASSSSDARAASSLAAAPAPATATGPAGGERLYLAEIPRELQTMCADYLSFWDAVRMYAEHRALLPMLQPCLRMRDDDYAAYVANKHVLRGMLRRAILVAFVQRNTELFNALVYFRGYLLELETKNHSGLWLFAMKRSADTGRDADADEETPLAVDLPRSWGTREDSLRFQAVWLLRPTIVTALQLAAARDAAPAGRVPRRWRINRLITSLANGVIGAYFVRARYEAQTRYLQHGPYGQNHTGANWRLVKVLDTNPNADMSVLLRLHYAPHASQLLESAAIAAFVTDDVPNVVVYESLADAQAYAANSAPRTLQQHETRDSRSEPIYSPTSPNYAPPAHDYDDLDEAAYDSD